MCIAIASEYWYVLNMYQEKRLKKWLLLVSFMYQIDSINYVQLCRSARKRIFRLGKQLSCNVVLGGSKGVKSPAKGGFSQHHLDGQQQ